MNPHGKVITLTEYLPSYLPKDDFSDRDAEILLARHADKVAVEWPTPKTRHQWSLSPLGWVGYIPLPHGSGLSLQPKVPIANLFRMLEIAFRLDSFRFLEGLFECRAIRDFYERLARLLADLLLKRARFGLYKAYREESESLPFVRGRLVMQDLFSNSVKDKVFCRYEDHTFDIEDNRIIAWTLHGILRSGLCRGPAQSLLRKAEGVLKHSVSLTPCDEWSCVGREYNRLNADYEPIHRLCRLFLSSSGPTQNAGNDSMVPFLVNMGRLFESFVGEWLARSLDPRYRVGSQVTLRVGGQGSPDMRMDLVLYDRGSGKPLCVLDTKYKSHPKVAPDDYNQVVAYADALGCENAVLVYPTSLKHPLDEKPGKIRVRSETFDLSGDLDASGKRFLERLDRSLG